MKVDAGDAVVDVVGDFRVEDLPPERDHVRRSARRDRDMAEAPLAGHESADERFHRRRHLGLGEQFERLTLGPEKAPELCDAAQRRFLARYLLDSDLARGETGEDSLQRGVAPDLPAERNVFL